MTATQQLKYLPIPNYKEPELSAHDQAAEPPDTLYEAIMSTTEAYVPAIVRKVPKRIIVMLQSTPMDQVINRSCFPRFQLS
jgi:putative heme iron utilization protein